MMSQPTLPLIYYQFSKDSYYIILSNVKEFIVYDCLNYSMKCRSQQFGGIRFLTSYGLSNIMMVVSSGDLIGTTPRYLYFWKYSYPPQVLHEIFTQQTIEDCQWNYQYISLITEHQCIIYEFSQSLGLVCTIQHYPKNMNYALSMNTQIPYLLFTSPNEIGNISIYDLQQQRLVNKLQAHQSNVTKLAVNTDCTMLATASQTGTIIRVFAIPTGDILYSFRIHNFSVVINSLAFCEKSNFLLCVSENGKISVGLVNERYQKENLFYYEKYGKIEQEQRQLVVAEDEDGFLSVYNPDDEEGSDDHSLHSHRSYFTSQTRTYSGGKNEGNNPSTSGFSIFNVFNVQSRQQMMDATFTGLQKIRGYSQEFFKDEKKGSFSESPGGPSSNVNKSPTVAHHVGTPTTASNTIPVHIDKKVVRPLFQAKVSTKDFEGFTAILKYVEVNLPIKEPKDDTIESIGSDSARIKDDRSMDGGDEEGDFDDTVSELTDTHTITNLAGGVRIEDEDTGSVRSKISHSKKPMPAFPKIRSNSSQAPSVKPPLQPSLAPTTGIEELKLLLLSKDGLFQRIDLNFLYSTQNLWKYNGKKIEAYMTDIITLVEDERVLTIDTI